jgi:hypothetical protein
MAQGLQHGSGHSIDDSKFEDRPSKTPRSEDGGLRSYKSTSSPVSDVVVPLILRNRSNSRCRLQVDHQGARVSQSLSLRKANLCLTPSTE